MFSNRVRYVVLSSAVAGSLMVSGCGNTASVSNPNGPTTPATPATLATGGAINVYAAVDNATPVVLQYAATVTGTPIPANSINISTSTDVEAIGVDKNSGTVYVTGYSYTDAQPEIWAYASGATGTATPTRTIMMGLTTTTEPQDLTVDSVGNVYVAVVDTNSGLGSVVEYNSTATGAATPVRTISGTSTGIVTPIALTVDSAGTLYVSSVTGTNVYQGTILEFASSATGNVAPLRSITGSNVFFYGIAVDSSLNLYATQEADGQQVTYANPKIVEFAPGASGAATPTKTLTSTSMTYLGGIQVDAIGNLYVVNGGQYSDTILGFGPNGNGVVTPGVTLTPTALNTNTLASLALK